MREKRDEILILRITKTEKNRIYEKMYGMGIRSLSAYIRKMALDGYCLNLERVNESYQLYAADIEDLRHRLDELIGIGKQILSKLSEL